MPSPAFAPEFESSLKTFLDQLQSSQSFPLPEVPGTLLDWLGKIRLIEKELLLRALRAGVPTWLPFETQINANGSVWSGDPQESYLFLRSVLIREQCNGLPDQDQRYERLVSMKTPLTELLPLDRSYLINKLVMEYLTQAAKKPWESQLRMALVIRWAKWFGELHANVQLGQVEKQRFRKALHDLVEDDLTADGSQVKLRLESLLDIVTYGRRLGTIEAAVPWNVVPARWFRRDATTGKISRNVGTWPTLTVSDYRAPVGLLCEVVLYPFFEPIPTVGDILGPCYFTGKLPASGVSKNTLKTMFLGSGDDVKWHLFEVGVSRIVSMLPGDALSAGVL